MLINNIHIEYWLEQRDGDGKFGPFYNVEEATACVIKEELSGYELKQVLSHIPF